MTTLTRSPHGPNSGTKHSWLLHAACRGRYALFDAETVYDAMRARHICVRHCLVLDDCRRFAASQERWYGVLAGMIAGWRTPSDPGCGVWCE